MKRFTQFGRTQAEELANAINEVWYKILIVVLLMLVGMAIGFGYGLKLVADASHRADTVARDLSNLNRQRALEAKESARKAQASAYATCRRQQESQPVTRDFFHLIRDLSVTAEQRHEFRHLHDELVAQRAFAVPKCIKPPKGAS